MSRLEDIKNEYAIKRGYKDFNEMYIDSNFKETNHYIGVVMQMYAEECVKASLEKASESFKNTAVKSIGTALKYFEETNHDTIYKRDIISFLHAFYQFESQGLLIVGMGYKRYDGKEITDLEGAYEGGFFTEKKPYQITNPENIVLL